MRMIAAIANTPTTEAMPTDLSLIHIYSVLLVSSSARLNGSMLPLLAGSQYQQPIAVAATVAGARRALLERRFDLVLINTPMPDDFGTQLALDVCENTGSGVLLLVKAEHYPDINARVSDFGVLTVSKPTTAQIMTQSLRLLRSTREPVSYTHLDVYKRQGEVRLRSVVSRMNFGRTWTPSFMTVFSAAL